MLTFVDDRAYRGYIKAMRNVQEGRHTRWSGTSSTAAAASCKPYRHGMEDQLGARGLVLDGKT